MSKMKKTIGSTVTAFLAMTLAAPSYAHWGAPSPFARYGADAFCTHADSGNTYVRRARVRVILNSFFVQFEGGGFVWHWDEVQLKNVSTSGRVDAVAVYFSPTAPDWLSGRADDLDRNVSRSVIGVDVSPVNSPSSAICQVTNG